MNPRLSNSKKWTAFPGDFIDQIKEALLETFGPQLRGSELIIEGRIYSSEILLRLGFKEPKALKQNNFEVSIEYKQDQAVDRIHDAIDAVKSSNSIQGNAAPDHYTSASMLDCLLHTPIQESLPSPSLAPLPSI